MAQIPELQERFDVPYNTEFVPIQWGQPGVLHEPEPDSDNGHIGLVYMHPQADYVTQPHGVMSHAAETRLTDYGFRVLLTNSRTHNYGAYHKHQILPDIAAAIEFMRNLPEIETVILMGQSGGSQLFGFYQNVAENGAEVWQHDDVLWKLPDELDDTRPQVSQERYDLNDLPAADALINFDVVIGYGPLGMIRVGPQVVDNDHPRARRSDLDMWDPDTTFDDDFLERFFQGQKDRMRGLIEYAQHRVEEIDAGDGHYTDDEPFIIPDTKSDITRVEPSLLSRTKQEWPLLDATDGSINDQIIEPAIPLDEDPFGEELGLGYAATSEPPLALQGSPVLQTTVKKFLSTSSAWPTDEYRLTENSIEGVDWHSSYTSLPANVEGISCPYLQVGMTGSRYVVQQETVFTRAESADKDIVFVDGGNHWYHPVAPKFGDTVAATYDYVSNWITDRF